MTDFSSPFASSPYYQTAIAAAQQYGINSQFFVAQIGAESGFNPVAVSKIPVNESLMGNPGVEEYAQGIAQILPTTNALYGNVNLNDPVASLNEAAKILADNLSKCGGDYVCASQKYGTIPKSGTLTKGQQAVVQAAQAANVAEGLPATGSACGSLDFVCNLKQWLGQSAANLLGIVVGLIILTAGIIMLRNKDGLSAVPGHLMDGATKLATLVAE